MAVAGSSRPRPILEQMSQERRRILQGLAAATALCALPRQSRAAAPASLPGDPFRLGVASGFPTDSSVVLWTRLAPQPAAPGGAMPEADWPLRHAAQASPDLMLHLGDYLYEGGPGGAGRVRLHTGQRCVTLADYRARYALYQSDADLQLAHASAPWFLTWDDHEVANDYSGATPGRVEDPQAFLARRAAAYQAW